MQKIGLKKLDRSFYIQSTTEVAKRLLGKYLIRIMKDGSRVVGRVVETEAYLGEKDKACHSAKGRTARNETMFHDGGHAYVYLIYGMYHCLNIVSETVDVPEAVLIRAIQPIEGIQIMQKGRNARGRKPLSSPPTTSKLKPMKKELDLCSGPGKLCQAFHITKDDDGLDLVESDEMFMCEEVSDENEDVDLYVLNEAGGGVDIKGIELEDIVSATRIGVDYAGTWAKEELRFYPQSMAAYVSVINTDRRVTKKRKK
eukprot:TRINITY_DN28573_c0_g1_i1.p1 TRINITY_DN28573_c0_g1~~TRINITY_DN28573_c0_g1_i1.p1  ORF type:complete len:263 (-),score=89.05 TRINITY_DN28573_c0_g1_i1:14-781(-)